MCDKILLTGYKVSGNIS